MMAANTMGEVVADKLDWFFREAEPLTLVVLDFLDKWKIKFNEKASILEAYQLVGLTVLVTWFVVSFGKCVVSCLRCEEPLWKRTKAIIFRLVIKLPIMRGIASREIDKSVQGIKDGMMKPYAGQTFTKELPLKRSTPQEILKLVKQYNSLTDVQWKKGKVSGGIYASMDNNELIDLMTQVFGETAYTNPLHPDVFPGVRKMEVEVVRIACDLFHGDDNSCGTMTTGGTESIVMACKAMRDYARAVKGIKHPEMIAPITVHAGFDKAAEYMNIRLIHVPVDSKTGKVNVTAMKRAITKNTIMLIGSSPNFPHGIIDPIPEIADLGLKYDIPVHVDACLGGWLLPFMREADYPVPVGDFSIPGVTSISADTHKYGYAPKGSSVVLYREPKYRHYQYSVCTDWPGGVYASPTVSGSRAGANIATCWASILFHGREGFVESTKKVIDAARKLKKAIQCTPGLQLVGDPLMSVVAATSNQFNVLEMSDQLTKRGWNLNTLQFPPAFHVCLTLMHTKEGVLDLLIQDIQSIAENLRKSPPSALTGQAAVYGMAAAIPDRSMIGDIAKHYLDAYYATD